MLWPEGTISIENVPRDLLRAVSHAYKILSWYENLTDDEVPPEWMWPFDEELRVWFEDVKQERNAKYGGSSSHDGGEDVPLMSNELAKNRG